MIAMMIFIHLLILLAIGFGVGYWLLITANKHEGRLKTIGESLGFTLIGLVILSAVFGFFSSMKIDDSDYIPSMRQENMQELYREQNDNTQSNEPGEIEQETNPQKINTSPKNEEETSLEGKGQPTKRDKDDND